MRMLQEMRGLMDPPGLIPGGSLRNIADACVLAIAATVVRQSLSLSSRGGLASAGNVGCGMQTRL
jgi:hypothetical protein